MKNRICPSCNSRPLGKHFNTKWCKPCARTKAKRPVSTLDSSQRAFVRAHQGKISGRQMAEELGVSWSNVMRYARDNKLSLATVTGSRKYLIRPALVRAVQKHYEAHGRAATEKAFPDVSVRSIVERYPGFAPRQVRWSEKQIIELAKMGGLVDYDAQARYFKRPRANSGAIKSVWVKRFGMSDGALHGMPHNIAKHILRSDAPEVKPKFMRLHLWVDMEKNLRKGTPRFIREAVETMADFQRWLFRTKNPRPAILKIIRERAP